MTTQSDERPEDWRRVAPMDGCTFSGYEASDKGRARSVDRKVGNRQLRGKVLATKPHEDGYVLVTIRCDSTDPDHDRRHTYTMHNLVLTTFDRPRPDGMEACHSPKGPAFNWWPEGVRWDTKAGNEADKVAAGTSGWPEPAYECRNFARCGNKVMKPGRRCLDCVAWVGREAAGLLGMGMDLLSVAGRFGYTHEDWVFKLAVQHGGYTGTRADALRQRPNLAQRIALRHRLRHGYVP